VSAISSYARARAVSAGHAFPIATRRHVHLSARPLVFVPLAMAGEANAPLAAMIGTDRARPTLLIVPQPRNRDLRFAFAASLADIVLDYLRSCTRSAEMLGNDQVFLDAPQLLVPNVAGIGFVKLLGRSTRYRRTTGPYPVPPQVPMLGRWLTYLDERSEHPGSSVLLAMTSVLGMHWASGQSALEDANLAALLGWVDPRDGVAGRDAAIAAEDPLVCPPAGPSTDPAFDNVTLAPTIRDWSSAEPDSPKWKRAQRTLERELRAQTEPTWQLMWRALDVLHGLPVADSVATRWTTDRRDFSRYHTYVNNGGLPQARRDGAVMAARRLRNLETEQNQYTAAQAADDPLIMANYRITGLAFKGTVVEVDRDRRVPGSKGRAVTRPVIRVRTADPVHLATGTAVQSPARPKQVGTIVQIDREPDATTVTLEISGGMTTAKVPPAGTVPELDEDLTYTSAYSESFSRIELPKTEDTPWTHGGPPQPYVPTNDDAQEVWE
jgi:hypothetical protein